LKAITERMNANTLTVVTGPPNFVFSAFADDLATVLNDGDELKLLPVATKGGFENVRDVRFLRGIDLGFTITNAWATFAAPARSAISPTKSFISAGSPMMKFTS